MTPHLADETSSGQIGNLPHNVKHGLQPKWRGFPTRER
jgi:hypothetical protein